MKDTKPKNSTPVRTRDSKLIGQTSERSEEKENPAFTGNRN